MLWSFTHLSRSSFIFSRSSSLSMSCFGFPFWSAFPLLSSFFFPNLFKISRKKSGGSNYQKKKQYLSNIKHRNFRQSRHWELLSRSIPDPMLQKKLPILNRLCTLGRSSYTLIWSLKCLKMLFERESSKAQQTWNAKHCSRGWTVISAHFNVAEGSSYHTTALEEVICKDYSTVTQTRPHVLLL